MITPLDIQNKVFAKGVRGYKEEDVDGFLDLVTLDLEKLIDENQKLKMQVKSLSSEVERYKGSEGAVIDTLEAAKALMSDISASAEKRASILLKNASLDAELIQREARDSVERLKEEALSLHNRVSSFRTRYRSLLESELEKFDTLTAELFSEMERDRLGELGAGGSDTVIREETPAAGTAEIPSAQSFRDAPDDMFKTITNLRTGEEY
ncbi:DivIVA domain-containing protein [Bacilliculturomica massiliensis]|uniref:DivIVA domain-containing protein n=1 Tax=Bacilliculturomica massiliensis TaxID=1917867 RepID=UPI00102F9EA4|nr:DivIVA domain-containing protein [Bacilliculturomica massiliensis]